MKMEQQELRSLQKKAVAIRREIVTMIHQAGTGHIGGDLSVTDILVDLYYKQMNVSPEQQKDPERDRFILSKGHSVEALYAVLFPEGGAQDVRAVRVEVHRPSEQQDPGHRG